MAILRRPSSHLVDFYATVVPAAIANVAQLFVGSVSMFQQFQVVPSAEQRSRLTGTSLGTNYGRKMPTKYIQGLTLQWLNVNAITVNIGYCRSSDDKGNLGIHAVRQPNITASGINGLDAGAVAANTWYGVYLIGDSTEVNPSQSILSTSFVSPTLPAGYDLYRLIGSIRTDGASQVTRFFQRWNNRTRRVWWGAQQALFLTNGNALAFTNVSAAGQVSPISKNAFLELRFVNSVGSAASDMAQFRPAGSSVADGPYQVRRGTSMSNAIFSVPLEMPLSAARELEYKVTQAINEISLRVLAYDDEI